MKKYWCANYDELIKCLHENNGIYMTFYETNKPAGVVVDSEGNIFVISSREVYDAIDAEEVELQPLTIEGFIGYVTDLNGRIYCYNDCNILIFFDKYSGDNLFRFKWSEDRVFTDCGDLFCGMLEDYYITKPKTYTELFEIIMTTAAYGLLPSRESWDEVIQYAKV